MSQQLGIILMVDVDAAVKANTLEGSTYLFDNMKLQGSEGLGTEKLVSAINGTHYCDGSQANEQVLNWLPYGVGSLPATLPKSFLADKARNSDLNAIEKIHQLVDTIKPAETQKTTTTEITHIIKELRNIKSNIGHETKVISHFRNDLKRLGPVGQKIMDVTGKLIINATQSDIPEISSLNPIITDITGEAVDKNIIYPAAYGSPDMITDGWYWAASVDTSRPGTYEYTLHVQLYRLSKDKDKDEWVWVPVNMTCKAYIKVSNLPKVNGFTGGGVCALPIL
jgi:hypothetical protein